MRIQTAIIFISLCTITLAQASSPVIPDAERGELLYENHCSGCHESKVHIRETHKANSISDIRWQVARWASELRLDWTDADIEDVTNFLYHRYYLNRTRK